MRNRFIMNSPMRVLSGHEWRGIPNWENLYEINNVGHVARVMQKSIDAKRLKPRYLKCYTSSMGYVYFNLKGVRLSVAGMVLTVFNRKPAAGEIPHHLNGILEDCRVENLEWRQEDDCPVYEAEAYRSLLTAARRKVQQHRPTSRFA